MAGNPKSKVLDQLRARFGDIRIVKGSKSLFIVGEDAARVYFRYSRLHSGGRTFFGLREVDLRQLEGHNSYICFLLDSGAPALFLPYEDFEQVFHNAKPASDGQYKAQLLTDGGALELYVARQGRFNVEGCIGLETLYRSIEAQRLRQHVAVSHSQVQTLLAGIGHMKGYDIFVPAGDVGKLDWSLTAQFRLKRQLPTAFEKVKGILSEIDVIWFQGSCDTIEGLYEVEHCTPVYSGLLRFNDILVTDSRVSRFSIVSNEVRRDLFSRQLFRPTFAKSGLSELCSFLEYANVVAWHERIAGGESDGAS